MKVFAIVTVATEIEGRFTAVRFEKSFLQATKAQEYVSKLSSNWQETIQMGNESVACICERAVHELDVEE